ncbi:DUF6401 family natural product biosynthesis protein [Actinomadura sp. NPDC047616]|uniref:DUF6401 family natural product biosynthesis protein n=1 Tax=Actinomadura sp. NPDC047616 TaxID=3155914 RepID=UPI0033FA63F8
MDDLSEELGLLVRDIGEAGVAEMACSPALVAAVDQHAAEIREMRLVPGRSQTEALLAYLHDFTEEVFRRGWRPNGTRDWEFVRIVTICWMLRQASGS